MANDEEASVESPSMARNVSAPSNNRIVVAFPFSAIKMEEPSESVAELASIIADLTELVAKTAPSPEADELVERAGRLANRTPGA